MIARIIATVFYSGYLKPAPGTWGTLAALPLGWLVAYWTGFFGFVLATVIAFGVGYWATGEETKGKEDHDPGEIVIDELVGVWIALLPVVYGASSMGADLLALYPGWIAAFLLFRLFDIWKPGPIGWADRRGGPMGVMLDDVIAGVFSAIGVIALAALFHLVILI